MAWTRRSSSAGETEESCKQAGIEYVVGRAAYATNARGQIIGDGGGFLKLIFREELDWLAQQRDAEIHYVVGSRHDPGPRRAMSSLWTPSLPRSPVP